MFGVGDVLEQSLSCLRQPDVWIAGSIGSLYICFFTVCTTDWFGTKCCAAGYISDASRVWRFMTTTLVRDMSESSSYHSAYSEDLAGILSLYHLFNLLRCNMEHSKPQRENRSICLICCQTSVKYFLNFIQLSTFCLYNLFSKSLVTHSW